MELVYLWVEEYKNIKNQGFNFSPRFTCSYENDELKIIDKEETKEPYLKNFFGKNVNITAIVGENGSGKSSIINIIQECVENNLYTGYILVYTDNNSELRYLSNYIKINYLELGVCTEFAQSTFIYNKSTHIAHAFRHYNLIEIDKKSIVNILVAMNENPKFKISTFMYLPTEIEIKLKDSETLIKENINFFKPLNREKIKNIFASITDSYHQYLFITYGREQGINVNMSILTNKKKLKGAVQEPISEINYYNYFIELINEEILNIKELTEKEKNIYIREGGYFHFFDFDMIDEKGRRFNHLSHGEQMIFGQLLNIYFYSNSKNNLIFLFDEPEIALHPDWQKKYLYEVVILLQMLKKTYQFIFTTHSPFLLSDLPKENIIFLEKFNKDDIEVKNRNQEEGNCKNVTDKTNIETFGANIHTLLSHGFFMQGGLMGEFAKEKINEVISILKKETLSKDEINRCKNIISIIGEPILKSTLEKMLDEKLNSNESELERLEREQKEIQEKIDRLKVKNETD